MGLDLLVENCSKPGHEAEWRRTLARSFDDQPQNDAEVERFQAISIPAYERVGAPRVGFDAAADAWIIAAQKVSDPDDVARVLDKFHGHYAVELVRCDGVPEYTHYGLYDGVDETSFRDTFLELCDAVLSDESISSAWDHKFPEEAIDYGRALLTAADAAEAVGAPPATEPAPVPKKRGLFSWLRREKEVPVTVPFEEQLKIVRAAGKWYLFWGERGHAIRAWS